MCCQVEFGAQPLLRNSKRATKICCLRGEPGIWLCSWRFSSRGKRCGHLLTPHSLPIARQQARVETPRLQSITPCPASSRGKRNGASKNRALTVFQDWGLNLKQTNPQKLAGETHLLHIKQHIFTNFTTFQSFCLNLILFSQ